MIDFKPANVEQRKFYSSFFTDKRERGCEYGFSNLVLWGQQNIAEAEGCLVRLSYYSGHISYAFPIGSGDKSEALKALQKDAQQRGIPCAFMGVYEEDKKLLEALYPNQYRFVSARDSFDYIYSINDLCDLAGRKYHQKRNHLHRFKDAYPEYKTELLTKENLHLARDFAAAWYKEKLAGNPVSDFDMEQIALDRAFRYFDQLGLEGMLLKNADEVLAITIASRISEDTFDVHFEKAKESVQGAYTAINNEFAKHLREKHPELLYLNREEDMGIEGLRRAKESYRPHHLIEKYMAFPVEAEYDQ
ncbi:MAG: DUF2156 domain-containing protein [Ruminococcus sp.]|nr:DUF2156 domain-containing protein [Ruminococcus sp.]